MAWVGDADAVRLSHGAALSRHSEEAEPAMPKKSTTLAVAGLIAAAATGVYIARQRARKLPREQDRAIAGALVALHDLQRRAARLALLRPLPVLARDYARRQWTLAEHGVRHANRYVAMDEPFGAQVRESSEPRLHALGASEDADFAQAYAHAMVQSQQEALIWLDERLLPMASEPGMRRVLERTRRQAIGQLQLALRLLRERPDDVERDEADLTDPARFSGQRRTEALIDESVEETFPASDPVSPFIAARVP